MNTKTSKKPRDSDNEFKKTKKPKFDNKHDPLRKNKKFYLQNRGIE